MALVGFPYFIRITVDSDKVDAPLVDWPVYVDLDDLPDDFFLNVNFDGSDIRITQADGVTEQAREVGGIDTGAKTGRIYFKASSLSSATPTEFQIHYGNAGASEPAFNATYGRNNTWVDYFLVAHFEALSDGTAGEYIDSTGLGNDGTGVSPYPGRVAGKMGNAAYYDPSSDRIDFGTDPSTRPADNLTLSCWLRHDVISSVDVALDIRSNNENQGYVILTGFPGSFRLNFLVHTSSGWDVQMQSNSAQNSGQWYKFDATFTSGRQRLYIDGVEQSASSTVSGSIGYDAGQSLKAGGGHNTFSGNRMEGSQDELRCSNVVRDGDWISTEHNNQFSSNTFYAVGAQESSNGDGAKRRFSTVFNPFGIAA